MAKTKPGSSEISNIAELPPLSDDLDILKKVISPEDETILQSDKIKELRQYESTLKKSESKRIKKLPKMTPEPNALNTMKIENDILSKDIETICFKIKTSIKDILKLLIKIRFNTGETYFKYRLNKPESVSDCIRNLILEEWERKKIELLELRKNNQSN